MSTNSLRVAAHELPPMPQFVATYGAPWNTPCFPQFLALMECVLERDGRCTREYAALHRCLVKHGLFEKEED